MIKIRIILYYVILFVCCGCANQSPVKQATDNVRENVKYLQANLPAQCLTPDVETAIKNINRQLKQIPDTCKKEIIQEKNRRRMWQLATFVLSILVLALLKILFRI